MKDPSSAPKFLFDAWEEKRRYGMHQMFLTDSYFRGLESLGKDIVLRQQIVFRRGSPPKEASISFGNTTSHLVLVISRGGTTSVHMDVVQGMEIQVPS